MLVACQLAGLSALEGHYAGLNALAQFGAEVVARPSWAASSRWRKHLQCDARHRQRDDEG